METHGLRNGVRAVVNAQFGLRLLEMTAHGLLT